MSRAVLDASAVLAVANSEPGADHVTRRSQRGVMSAVNVAEVFAKLLLRGVPAADIALGIGSLVADVVPFDQVQAEAAAALHARTRALGLSLADTACLALGVRLGLAVVTTDRDWKKVEGVGPVEVIR
ncbi:MAG TPA: type II toxin-antitoxin system VapC family toxin [Urbifossiella sp.]|jgi:PIN domain nuclease of toxin-antitoxin system|nr:type II toxin-antitoxin system VapC family toxin [Urbifossiella sp.]